MNKNLKVLVSTYACEPNKGSEPGVGWNWAKQIAKFSEVHVITRANNRHLIEEELKKSPVPDLFFHYYDVPKWLSFWKKKTRGLHLYYLLWQIGAYNVAKGLHKRERFDLVHHITFGNIWLPTFMPFLGIPFIWGPIGGGERVPRQFRKDYSITSKIQEFLRDFIVLTLRINPFFLLASKKASLIISRTKESFDAVPAKLRFKAITLIETGIEGSAIKKLILERKGVKILSAGRLIHLKGFDLSLKAFDLASRKSKGLEMIIIGNGPDMKRLQGLCKELGLSDKVTFTGYLSNSEVLEYMAESDIFLYPSLKEAGAWVLFEAMSTGMPVICLDIAGPAEIVSEDCGIKIKPDTPEQTVKELAAAIIRLIENPELRKKMGEAGRKRVLEHYTWEKKGELIRRIYEEVFGKKLLGDS